MEITIPEDGEDPLNCSLKYEALNSDFSSDLFFIKSVEIEAFEDRPRFYVYVHEDKIARSAFFDPLIIITVVLVLLFIPIALCTMVFDLTS